MTKRWWLLRSYRSCSWRRPKVCLTPPIYIQHATPISIFSDPLTLPLAYDVIRKSSFPQKHPFMALKGMLLERESPDLAAKIKLELCFIKSSIICLFFAFFFIKLRLISSHIDLMI